MNIVGDKMAAMVVATCLMSIALVLGFQVTET